MAVSKDRVSVAGRRALETSSLSEQVANLLLEDLTSGVLKPGERINEAALARVLGISRNPIREAVHGLAQRGFLVALPRRGHFLRRFTPKDVNDIFAFRVCVESFAIRQALPLMTRAEHGALRGVVDRMIEAAQAARLTALRQADIELHRRICQLSGNRLTVKAHEGIDTEVQILIASVDLGHESPIDSALSHVPIVEAMATGDVERSVAAMEQHLRKTWSYVFQVYEKAEAARVRAGRLEDRSQLRVQGRAREEGTRETSA